MNPSKNTQPLAGVSNRSIEQAWASHVGKKKALRSPNYLSHRRASVVYLGLADLQVFEMCFIL
jgi:hypothetical protein